MKSVALLLVVIALGACSSPEASQAEPPTLPASADALLFARQACGLVDQSGNPLEYAGPDVTAFNWMDPLEELAPRADDAKRRAVLSEAAALKDKKWRELADAQAIGSEFWSQLMEVRERQPKYLYEALVEAFPNSNEDYQRYMKAVDRWDTICLAIAVAQG